MKKNQRMPALAALCLAVGLAACGNMKLENRLLSDDSKTRERAMGRLGSLPTIERARLVSPLMDALKSGDGRLANRAEEALIAIGEPCLPAVIEQVGAPDPFLRIIAANMLGEIGARPDTVVPALARQLKDQHPLVREEAAHALGRFGPRADAALPALRAAENDQAAEVADAVRQALGQIERPAATPTPAASPIAPASKPGA